MTGPRELIRRRTRIVNKTGWCCRRGLNSRPLPYQGSALPLSYGSVSGGAATRAGQGADSAIGVAPAQACRSEATPQAGYSAACSARGEAQAERPPGLDERLREGLDQGVGVERARRDAQALRAARHGRIVDRLDVDAVPVEQPVATRPCRLPRRPPSPARCGSRSAAPAARRRASAALVRATWRCCASRSARGRLQWRIEAGRRGATAGGRAVVKMKPGRSCARRR